MEHFYSSWIEKSKTINFESHSFINGKYIPPKNGKYLRRYSPIDGKYLGKIADCSHHDVEYAVSVARKAFSDGRWRHLSVAKRKSIMISISRLIEKYAEQFALLDSLSMGKAITSCLSHDIVKASECFAWYAEAIDKIYDKALPPTTHSLGLISREPLGVIGAISPWNYPMENIAWKIAPALAAGNTIVLKPAEQSTFSALLFARIASEAGLPDGVLNILPGKGENTGRYLALHNDVDGIYFTGSSVVGKKILNYSSLSNMKRASLECGGKSAFIVLQDCRNLDETAQILCRNIFFNQGQTCSAPSRAIIEQGIYDLFVEKVIKYSSMYKPNHPLMETTQVGALVSKEQLATVESFVAKGIQEGADLLIGGTALNPVKGGSYYAPTVFGNVLNDAIIAQEEIFGPVLSIIKANDHIEALEMANDNKYGLAAGIWTNNLDLAHSMAQKLQAGVVHINSYGEDGMAVPFGGYKQSGNGCKDRSLYAIDDYSNFKVTWLELRNDPRFLK